MPSAACAMATCVETLRLRFDLILESLLAWKVARKRAAKGLPAPFIYAPIDRRDVSEVTIRRARGSSPHECALGARPFSNLRPVRSKAWAVPQKKARPSLIQRDGCSTCA